MRTSKTQNGSQGAPNVQQGLEMGVPLRFFGRSFQLLLNKFFDPSTSSMRKGCDGEEKRKEKRQAGSELCQVQHSLSQMDLASHLLRMLGMEQKA